MFGYIILALIYWLESQFCSIQLSLIHTYTYKPYVPGEDLDLLCFTFMTTYLKSC